MTHDKREEIMIFESDVIDLSHIDLAALSEVPSTVLRAAIARVREELSGNGDKSTVYAGFRSSLPDLHTENQTLEGSEGAAAARDTLP